MATAPVSSIFSPTGANYTKKYQRQSPTMSNGEAARARHYSIFSDNKEAAPHRLNSRLESKKHSLPPVAIDNVLKWSQAEQITQRMVKTGYGLKRNSICGSHAGI